MANLRPFVRFQTWLFGWLQAGRGQPFVDVGGLSQLLGLGVRPL
jgi:hypothetical protein